MEEHEIKWVAIGIIGCALATALCAFAPRNESRELQQLRMAVEQYQRPAN